MWKSWKTTAAGIAAAVAAWAMQLQALWDADPATVPDWGIPVAATIAAIGLIVARDNDKTSEASGAKAKEDRKWSY
jgi:hypothetical protein